MGTHLFAPLAVASAVFAQGPQFVVDTPASLASLVCQRSIAADIDGDGDLDLIGTGVFFQATLLRNDDGQLVDVTASQMPALGGSPIAAVAFDADGDGDVDLFVCGNGMPSQLLRNDGTGTFVVAQTMPFAPSQLGAAAADLDGDGDLDLAVSGSVLVGSFDQLLENDGSGGFALAASLVSPLSSIVTALDFDGDGDQDLAFGDANSRLLRNDGAFAFVDVTASHLLMTPAWTYGIVAADLDGDGDQDLIVHNRAPAADVALENVGGVLTEVATLPMPGETESLAVGDIDGDGDPDVVRAHDTGRVSILVNDGAGGLVSAPTRMPAQNLWASGVQLLDLDRDGDPELFGWLPFSSWMLRNRDRDLAVPAALRGQPWTCTIASEPGYATAPHVARLVVGLARLAQPLPVPAVGNVWLDLSAPYVDVVGVVQPAAGTAGFAFAIPNGPALVGVEMHVQAVVAQPPHGLGLTTLRSTTIQ